MRNFAFQNLGPLSANERWLVMQTAVLLPATALLLRRLGFWRCYRAFARSTERPSGNWQSSDDVIRKAERVAAIVAMTNERYSPLYAACLPKSLVLWRALRVRGLPAEFYLGVRTLMGPFEAHAWVEVGGVVLDDVPDVATIYAPFDLSRLTPSRVQP